MCSRLVLHQCVSPRRVPTSDRHGVDRADQVYVILHATYSAILPDEGLDDETVTLDIGPRHARTQREIEGGTRLPR